MNKLLVGKTINSIEVSVSKDWVKFNCKEGIFYAYCTADCCSETWIEHMSIPDRINEFLVESVEEIELGEGIGTRQEYDKLYGVKLKSSKRYEDIFIEFRNSSNGYYGGSINFTDDPKKFRHGSTNFDEITFKSLASGF